MSVVASELVYLRPVLQHELQPVLVFPIAFALDRDVHALVTPGPAADHRLASELNVLPKFVGRIDGLRVILEPPILEVLVVTKERFVDFTQNSRTA